MAWRAIFTRVNREDGTVPAAIVVFTDDLTTKREETIPLLGLTAESFRARVEAMRSGFESSYDFITTVDPSTFDLTPAPPPEEDKEQKAFMLALGAIERELRQITRGFAATADMDALRTVITDAIAARPDLAELL